MKVTKEIERMIQENIDQDPGTIIAKINDKFTSEQIQRLNPARDPNKYIADKIKHNKGFTGDDLPPSCAPQAVWS